LIGLVALNIIQFIFIHRIDWAKKSQEAVDLGAQDVVELKSFSNPAYGADSTDEKSAIGDTKMTLEGEEEEEDEVNPLKGALFVQILKRAAIGVFFVLLFLVSIYTRGIKSFDDIYPNNATLATPTNKP
jgi:hypothetical protein